MTPERIALDTSAYSHLRRGHEGVLQIVSQAALVYLPITVLGELEAGFRLGSRYAENMRQLDELLAEPFVESLDVTRRVAIRYGEVFAKLRAAGTPIPVNDIWIAATTMSAGAHLLTFDSDFARVEGFTHTLLR